jgi:hypothetical protein
MHLTKDAPDQRKSINLCKNYFILFVFTVHNKGKVSTSQDVAMISAAKLKEAIPATINY